MQGVSCAPLQSIGTRLQGATDKIETNLTELTSKANVIHASLFCAWFVLSNHLLTNPGSE